ncbi:hypothetical protein ACFU98_46675 [Streptomyces sp. NPDC057575]|uniref:hypothetical protein n=1 Tax=unclassified Streptomyces TaxID=2593676 RepID=UPI0036BF1CA5
MSENEIQLKAIAALTALRGGVGADYVSDLLGEVIPTHFLVPDTADPAEVGLAVLDQLSEPLSALVNGFVLAFETLADRVRPDGTRGSCRRDPAGTRAGHCARGRLIPTEVRPHCERGDSLHIRRREGTAEAAPAGSSQAPPCRPLRRLPIMRRQVSRQGAPVASAVIGTTGFPLSSLSARRGGRKSSGRTALIRAVPTKLLGVPDEAVNALGEVGTGVPQVVTGSGQGCDERGDVVLSERAVQLGKARPRLLWQVGECGDLSGEPTQVGRMATCPHHDRPVGGTLVAGPCGR